MDSVNVAVEKFNEILKDKTSWAALQGSQFVEHLAIFVSWCLRSAQWAVERAKQEFFIGTAINRSSIIAHAESREYLPRKPIPSTGTLTILNDGDADVSLVAETEFLTENDLLVTLIDSKTISPGNSDTIAAEQKEFKEFTFDITGDIIFREILIGIEDSKITSGVDVFVDIKDGNGLVQWIYSRLLQNAYPTSMVYDEFYASTDQIGIRFGDGIFGLLPPGGSTIVLRTWQTSGDIYIAPGQELYAVSDILDVNGNSSVLSLDVATAFQGGVAWEKLEEIRTSLHYWPIFNDQLVWDDDYIFYTKRRFPSITWINVWGEKEAEIQAGAPDVSFINVIFISAYASGGASIETEVITMLDEKAKKTNRTFQWVVPNTVNFTLLIAGKVEKSRSITDIEVAILKVLTDNYGPDSYTRKNPVLIKEIYALIDGLGFFDKSKEEFEITPAGTTTATLLEDFVSIDIDNTTISLGYL